MGSKKGLVIFATLCWSQSSCHFLRKTPENLCGTQNLWYVHFLQRDFFQVLYQLLGCLRWWNARNLKPLLCCSNCRGCPQMWCAWVTHPHLWWQLLYTAYTRTEHLQIQMKDVALWWLHAVFLCCGFSSSIFYTKFGIHIFVFVIPKASTSSLKKHPELWSHDENVWDEKLKQCLLPSRKWITYPTKREVWKIIDSTMPMFLGGYVSSLEGIF